MKLTLALVSSTVEGNLDEVKKVNLSKKEIEEICELGFLRGMEHLDLSKNQLSSIQEWQNHARKSMAKHPKSLNCYMRQGVEKCLKLKGLNCSHNMISDMEPLADLSELNGISQEKILMIIFKLI